MVSSELLAITAIFTTGIFVGFKIREASYNLGKYVSTKNKSKEVKFF